MELPDSQEKAVAQSGARAVETAAPVAAAQTAQGHHAGIADYIESLLFTILIALFATTFVVQASRFLRNRWSPLCWWATIYW